MSQEKAKPKSEVNIQKMLITLAVAVGIALVPPPEGLTVQSMQFLGIFVGMVVGMLLNAAQMWVMTNIAGMAAIALGLGKFNTIYAEFAGSTIWMVLAVVGFAGCLASSGLMTRIAFSVLKMFPPNFAGQTLAILTASTVIGPMIPSSTAKLAIMAPFTGQVAKETGIEPHSRGLKGLWFIMFTANFIAAPMFLTGTNITFIMLGMIPPEVAADFTWGHWFASAGVWGGVLLGLTALFTIVFLKPAKPISMSKEFLNEKLAAIGPMSGDEKFCGGVLIFAIAMWITVEMHGINAGVTSWVALLAMHFRGLFSSKDAQMKLPWALCLMFGPMMGVAALMKPMGITDWVASMLGGVSSLIPNGFVFVIIMTLLVWIMRLVIDQISILAISIAIFAPIASMLGISVWVVIFVAWANAQQWILPHNNIGVFQTIGMMGDDLISYKDVQSLSFVYMALTLIATLASVPVWSAMGMM